MQYKDMVDIYLSNELADIDLIPLIQAIDNLKSGTYWESKNARLIHLKDSQTIADSLAKATIGRELTIQELIGKSHYLFSDNCEFSDSLLNCSDIIEACNEIIFSIRITDTINVSSFYYLEDETIDYLNLSTFNPPMKVKPLDWTDNSTGGYYDNDLHCILGSHLSHHTGYQALDVLNILQQISWELDTHISSLDELPNKELPTKDAQVAFNQMARESKDLYQKYSAIPFWFIWQFDKRGRQYSKGYHINLQSSGYKKAILNFTEKELINGIL